MRWSIRVRLGGAVLAGAVLLAGCAVNPATGKRQFVLISESQEIAIGKQNDPTIQKQFGAYENAELIYERHRHRFEVSNSYREALEEQGMLLAGQSPDGRLVEIIELRDHPWFVASQFHPEFKSRPESPHPLFAGFVSAAIEREGSAAVATPVAERA